MTALLHRFAGEPTLPTTLFEGALDWVVEQVRFSFMGVMNTQHVNIETHHLRNGMLSLL